MALAVASDVILPDQQVGQEAIAAAGGEVGDPEPPGREGVLPHRPSAAKMQ